MKLYIAIGSAPHVEQFMKLYIAGIESEKNRIEDVHNLLNQKMYVLGSFYMYYKQSLTWTLEYIDKQWDFILDSGAYTFMNDEALLKKTNIEHYIEAYAAFINKFNIEYFFELDLDNLVGISKVEEYRKAIEKKTGKQCIPVWHKSRGKQYWIDLCKEYKYVAIGGIVSGEIKKSEYGLFNYFINIANEYDCKVHGLGFTPTNIETYRFFSTDSAAWLYGNISGTFVYMFDGSQMKKIIKPDGHTLNGKNVATHNFKQWLEYQKYLDR